MGTVYYFVSNSFVWNDKIVPVILELARQGNKVYTVFEGSRGHQELRRAVPYYAWLERYTTIFPIYKTSKGLWGNIQRELRMAWLMFRMRFFKGYLAFFESKPVSMLRVLRFSNLAKAHGRSVLYSPRYAEYRNEIDEKAMVEACAKELKKGKISPVMDRKIYHKSHTFLAYHPELAGEAKSVGAQGVLLLHLPKLQAWWRSFVQATPPRYDIPELAEASEFIPVFLTHFGNCFFEDGSDLDSFVSDILMAIRQQYPDTLIVLKPKFTVDVGRLRKALPSGSLDNVVVSSTPVSVLAEKALFGVTVCQTSAQFEFLNSGKGWIEYCRYAGFWKQVYPQETYTTKFGGIYARYFDELGEAIDRATRTGYDLDAFKKMIGFVAQDIDFDFFTQEPENIP